MQQTNPHLGCLAVVRSFSPFWAVVYFWCRCHKIKRVNIPRVFSSSSPGATLKLGLLASMNWLMTNIFFSFKSFFHGLSTMILTLYWMKPCSPWKDEGILSGRVNSKGYSWLPASCSLLSSSPYPWYKKNEML